MTERGYIDAAPGRRTAAGALLIGGYHPSKLWVGGLPDSATLADLEDCFGQIGPCTCNIKKGFGFVEYNDPAHAQEAVAKYNEGHFLGAQIKVEFSLARAPPNKAGSDAGASPYPESAPSTTVPGLPVVNSSGCFVCGSLRHWARECPDADKMPQRNPPGSDRPSDARKPMWINGPPPDKSKSAPPRGGRSDPPPAGRYGPPGGPPGPPAPYGAPPPVYPPRYDAPPFDRPPYGVSPTPRYGAPPPPPPGYGGRADPYYDRPPRDPYAPYAAPPAPAGYPPAPAIPFDRPPYPTNGAPPPPLGAARDPYGERYGAPLPPPGRSPVMPPAPYDAARGPPVDLARPPYDPYGRPPMPPLDGPPGGYDPREERPGPPARYAPYPGRDERGRPDGPYGGRSPRMERRRSLSPRRGSGYGPPPGSEYYSSRAPAPPGGYGRPVSPPGYGRPGSPPRYPPADDPYARR
ncbi:hypothetical protein JCM10212_004755 [Sporobolomyces blumeae]